MRTKKAFWNTITSLVYQILTIVSGLIVPRLILEYYGSELNGIVSSANQFLNVISILTVGLTGAARVVLYKSLAENDSYTTNSLMNATIRYMNKVSVALIIYTLLLAVIYPYFVHTDITVQTISLIILVVGFGKFVEYFMGIPYRILLQADQKNYIENILSCISCIIYTVLSVIMIRRHFTIISVKLVSAFISLGVVINICLYVRKQYHLTREKVYNKSFLSLRKDAAVHSIANVVHQNSDLIILTLFVDIKLISVYTVYYFIIGQIKRLLESFTGGLEAAFGNLWAKKEYENVTEKFQLYELFISMFVSVVFACVTVLILPFVRLYTGHVNDVNYIQYSLAFLISCAEIVYCIRQPYVTLVQAAGRYRDTKNSAIIEACVNLILSSILVWRLGINGVIIGTLCANCIRTLYYVYYVSKKLLNRGITKVIKCLIWTLITLSISASAGYIIIMYFIKINDWLSWMFAGCIIFGEALVITLISANIFYYKDISKICNIIKIILLRK